MSGKTTAMAAAGQVKVSYPSLVQSSINIATVAAASAITKQPKAPIPPRTVRTIHTAMAEVIRNAADRKRVTVKGNDQAGNETGHGYPQLAGSQLTDKILFGHM